MPNKPALSERHLLRCYPEAAFGGYTAVDGTVAFYQRVRALLNPQATVLDVGCGRGAYCEDSNRFRRELRLLRGLVKEVVGIDRDPAASGNPGIDRFALMESDDWPVPDRHFDVCIADWVLEHVTQPERFFAELQRVLRPGGVFCARTVNRHGYVATAARLVPAQWQAAVLRRAQPARKSADVFPTVYRCNTARRLQRQLESVGFHVVVLAQDSEPGYADSMQWAWLLGRFYQRHAPRWLRNNLFVFASLGERESSGRAQ